jgi:hypothetical protein
MRQKMDERKQGRKRKRRKRDTKVKAKERQGDTRMALRGHGRRVQSGSQSLADAGQETHQLGRET